MTPETLRKEFEGQSKGKWWTNPVCHGDMAFASWEYQEWLESKVIQLHSELREARDKALEEAANLCDQIQDEAYTLQPAHCAARLRSLKSQEAQ